MSANNALYNNARYSLTPAATAAFAAIVAVCYLFLLTHLFKCVLYTQFHVRTHVVMWM